MCTIPSGRVVTATLSLERGAAGTALLMIGHAPHGGPAQSDSRSVAPGTAGSVSITPEGFGILRVHVDMADDSDAGTLQVEPVDPTPVPVQGDMNKGCVVVE